MSHQPLERNTRDACGEHLLSQSLPSLRIRSRPVLKDDEEPTLTLCRDKLHFVTTTSRKIQRRCDETDFIASIEKEKPPRTPSKTNGQLMTQPTNVEETETTKMTSSTNLDVMTPPREDSSDDFPFILVAPPSLKKEAASWPMNPTSPDFRHVRNVSFDDEANIQCTEDSSSSSCPCTPSSTHVSPCSGRSGSDRGLQTR